MPEVRQSVPDVAAAAVRQQTASDLKGATVVRGWEPEQGCTLEHVLGAAHSTGCQASALGQAIVEVNRMLDWRLSHEPCPPDAEAEQQDPGYRASTRCKIFLGYTSNMASSGVREQIRYLVKHKMVDVVVTSAGGVEEDLIKCLAPSYMGSFKAQGAQLRSQGLNRIGNMLVPNSNYCAFEDWLMPILDTLLAEQSRGQHWTPSKLIHRLGKDINHPDSICYWAARNGIPIYSPAITDGSIGDMLYFHTFKSPGLILDLVADIRAMNDEAVHAAPCKTGMLILGGGVAKHHICNANLMRNGADFSVFINTAQEFDCSDSGAAPDEAVSWGKIRPEALPVKVCADASLVFPLLISQTFCRHQPQAAPKEAV